MRARETESGSQSAVQGTNHSKITPCSRHDLPGCARALPLPLSITHLRALPSPLPSPIWANYDDYRKPLLALVFPFKICISVLMQGKWRAQGAPRAHAQGDYGKHD